MIVTGRFIKVDDGDNQRRSTSSKRDDTGSDEVSRAGSDDKPAVVMIKTHAKKIIGYWSKSHGRQPTGSCD